MTTDEKIAFLQQMLKEAQAHEYKLWANWQIAAAQVVTLAQLLTDLQSK